MRAMQSLLAAAQLAGLEFKAGPCFFGLCATIAGFVVASAIGWFNKRAWDKGKAEAATRNALVEMVVAERDRLKSNMDAATALAEANVVTPFQGGPVEFGFVFGDEPPFSERFPYPPGIAHRMAWVAVANVGGEHLDDCRVTIERMPPGPEQGAAPCDPIMATTDGFSLRPGARKLLEIASYDERFPDGTAARGIRIGGSTTLGKAMVPADMVHTLQLRAIAADRVLATASCRLFVEEGRLRLLKR